MRNPQTFCLRLRELSAFCDLVLSMTACMSRMRSKRDENVLHFKETKCIPDGSNQQDLARSCFSLVRVGPHRKGLDGFKYST